MGGSSLGPEVIRRTFGDIEGAMRLHVLDSTDPGRGARGRGPDRPGQDALHRLLEVRRDDRDAVALPLLPRAGRRGGRGGPGGQALRGRHRPGQPARDPGGVQRLPPRVRERPRHRRALLRALLLRARAGGLHGRGDRGAAASLPGGRAELHQLRPGHQQLGPVARHRPGRARQRRARQVHVHRVRADLLVRPLGRAVDRREHRQAGEGRAAGGGRADRAARVPTATTGCSPTCATPTSPTRTWTPRSTRSPGAASRC